MSNDNCDEWTSQRNKARQQIKEWSNQIQDIQYKIRCLAIDLDPAREFEYNLQIVRIITRWKCPDSPFGWCAYHTIEDPALDSCISASNAVRRLVISVSKASFLACWASIRAARSDAAVSTP